MGLFSKFINLFSASPSPSPEEIYAQAEQAYDEGNLYELYAIRLDLIRSCDGYIRDEVPEYKKFDLLYDKLLHQKEDEILSKYKQDIVKLEDDFSTEVKWVYHSIHPDDSTCVSLYFYGSNSNTIIRYEDMKLKISYNSSDNSTDFSKVIFSNKNKETFSLEYGDDWMLKDIRSGTNYSALDYNLGVFLTSSDSRFHPILLYFNRSLLNGNGLKIRLFDSCGVEIITRELSETEVAGLRHMIAAHFETANYIRSLLHLAPLPTI